MPRIFVATLCTVALIMTGLFPVPAATAEPFRRGMNAGGIFDGFSMRKRAPDTPANAVPKWRAQISEAELARLRQVGFDFIRLPVDPARLAEGPDDAVLADVLDFVGTAGRYGLAVLVDLHPRDDNPRWSAAAVQDGIEGKSFRRYIDLSQRVATKLAAFRTSDVALELMNEPQKPCVQTKGTDWSEYQRVLHAAVRSVAPNLNLVVTGGCWSSVDGLESWDAHPVMDANTFVMVHFYEPHAFTHQGAGWSMPGLRVVRGLAYPVEPTRRDEALRATEAQAAAPADLQQARKIINDYHRKPFGRAEIAHKFERVAAWADRMGIPRGRVIVGEFGVLRLPGSETARVAWLRDVVDAIERQGLGWAYWSYAGAFGLALDDEARTLPPDILNAFFPTARAP